MPLLLFMRMKRQMNTVIIHQRHDCRGHAEKPLLEIDDDQRCASLGLYPGLLLRYVELNEPEDVAVDFQCNGAVLEFGCLVSGQIRGCASYGNGRKRYLDAGPGQTWCSFCTKARGTIEYLPGQPICVISFLIYEPLLKNLPLLGSNAAALKEPLWEKEAFHTTGTLTPTVRQIVHQIVQGREHTDMPNQLLLMSKAYELLFHLSRVEHDGGDNDKRHCPAKYQGVRRAQDILDQNLASPPSLVDLARQSGLCVTNLTEEFKKQFGTTVFGYLRQQRLARAKELITLYNMTASEAAWEVGYSSLSSFHKAFLSRYGTTPGSFCRRS